MTPLRIGEREEPTAKMPWVLTAYNGQRSDTYRFRTEHERDTLRARLTEHYQPTNNKDTNS